METQTKPCPTCGLELDPATGLCLFCGPAPQSAARDAFLRLEEEAPLQSAATAAPQPVVAQPVAAQPVVPQPGVPQPVAPQPSAPAPAEASEAAPAAAPGMEGPGGARELGLLLFEAEEALARGAAQKALVLASKAVKERPDSLTARSLQERARRELLRGKRRDRLEERVREAEGLLQAGDMAGAEKIVNSALKLIPNHPVALALFGKLKERRQQAPTAEAWAEQELDRLTQARARRSLETARAEMAAGRERKAMMAIRRGLRNAPDDAELLAMLRDIEGAMERAKAGHHAVHAQVRAGLDLLAQGQIDESLRVLRAVLQADPDNARAQAAVQDVRRAWLRREAMAASVPPLPARAPSPPPAAPSAAAAPAPPVSSPPPRPAAAPPSPGASGVRPPVAPAAQRPQGSPAPPAPASAAPAARPPAAASANPAPSAAPPPAPPPKVSWEDVEAVAQGRAVPHVKIPSARVPPATRSLPPRSGAATAAPVAAESRGARGLMVPIGVVLALLVLVGAGVAMSRRGSRPAESAGPRLAGTAAAPRAAAPRRDAPPAAAPVVGGPLATTDPDLRVAVEAMFVTYARALETADAALLAEARPDLTVPERDKLVAPFVGAVNAATDLRVIEVTTRGDLATVKLLRTDVIVGGPGGGSDPVQEELHFWRRRGEWMLVR